MEKINLKLVSYETRKIIKQQVISLLKKKLTQKEIAEIIGISTQVVKRISSAYKKEGATCMKEKTRDRKFDEKRQLSPEQEMEIIDLLTKKSLDQIGWILCSGHERLSAR